MRPAILDGRSIHTVLERHAAGELELHEGRAPSARDSTPDARTSSSAVTWPVAEAREERSGRRRARRTRRAVSRARGRRASSTSSAHVTGVAPSRSSALVPADSALVISPGTASTSRPSSSAKSAVMSAPLRSRASTTTVASTEAGDDPVARGEPPRGRLDSGLVLGDHEALSRRCAARARHARPGSRGRRRSRAPRPSTPPAVERAAMRLAVDPAGHPAHDDETGGGELAGERARHRATVRRARSRTDDGHGRPVEERRLRRAAEEELRRRIVDRSEQRRERGVASPDAADRGHVAEQLSRHPVRQRLGDVSRLDGRGARPARRSCEQRARRARARGRRAGGGRRRSRAAPTRPPSSGAATSQPCSAPREHGLARSPTPPPVAPRARPRAAEASRRRGRIDRGARERASPDRRRAAAACTRTRRRDRRARRTGTCSSCRRAGSEPGRSRARRRARPRRSRPRAAVAATRGRSAGTPGARP